MREQLALGIDRAAQRIEVERILGCPRYYRVWLYTSDAALRDKHQCLNPIGPEIKDKHLQGTLRGKVTYHVDEWYVAGLRAAALAGQMKWGHSLPVYLDRGWGEGLRLISNGGAHGPTL